MQIVTRISTRVTPFLPLVRLWKVVFTMIQSLRPKGQLVSSVMESRRHGGIHYARDREGRTPFRRPNYGLVAEGSRCEQAFLLRAMAIPDGERGQKLHARRAWPVPSDSSRSQGRAPRIVLAEVPWKEAPVEDEGAPMRVSVPSLPHKIYPPFYCRRRVLFGRNTTGLPCSFNRRHISPRR